MSKEPIWEVSLDGKQWCREDEVQVDRRLWPEEGWPYRRQVTMKHSPGPWRWAGPLEVDPGEYVFEVNDEQGGVVATLEGDEADRDAQLISLAPQMAEMLRELEWAGGEGLARCPVCEQRPEHQRYIPGPPVDGMPGFVHLGRSSEIVPGDHTPDCRLAALLKALPDAPGSPETEEG